MAAAVEIVSVESGKGRAADLFVELPYLLYRDSECWVPKFRRDTRAILSRRHPFFAAGSAAFFLALRAGKPVGTLGAIDNGEFNAFHGTKTGHFHFFDCADDPEASHALFDAAFTWMRGRGLTLAQGPTGFGLMGMGILVEGFAERAAMTMMGYNHPYYAKLLEAEGFVKYKDQLSAHIDARSFRLPDKIRRVAEIALARGNFTVPEFRSTRELARHAREIGRVYNEAFLHMGDDYLPMSEGEIDQVTSELMLVADPSLIKLLLYKGEIAGFLFGFPDLSAAIRRSRGRITPFALADILFEYRRTRRLIVNGAGILPKFQRLGGNALLYYALEQIATQKRFFDVESVSVAETTEMMLADLQTLGAKVYKVHRVYRRPI